MTCQEAHAVQNTLERGSELELSHPQDLRDSTGPLPKCGWGFPAPSVVQLHDKAGRCMELSPVGKDKELLWAAFASYPGF